ncbi:MAG: formate/nitrite transporter family protein [Pseudoflavonifractor sp.]
MTRPVVDIIGTAGSAKAADSKSDLSRYLTRAALAGAFIFVGTLLSSLSAAWFYADHLGFAKLLGALTFSAALILIVLLGGELFTGTNLVMGVALYDGRVSPAAALRVWALAYAGNFLGILILALLLSGSGACRDLLSSRVYRGLGGL